MVLDDKSIHADNESSAASIKYPVVCPICKSNSVITDPESGEIVCSQCGMVISDKIQETRQESRSFLSTEQAKDTRKVFFFQKHQKK
jgi:transcription initiation factor TFIIB